MIPLKRKRAEMKKYRKQILFLIDLGIAAFVYLVLLGLCSLYDSYIVQSLRDVRIFGIDLAIFLSCISLVFWILKLYDSIWRYAELEEYISLIGGTVIAFSIYSILGRLVLQSGISMMFSATVCSVTLLLMISLRFVYRQFRRYSIAQNEQAKVRLGIVGGGMAGAALLREIARNPKYAYEPVCVFDDDIEKIGKFIHKVEVIGSIDRVPVESEIQKLDEIIIAIQTITPEQQRRIISICSRAKCRVKILPDALGSAQETIQDSSLVSRVRNINVEDLLGRNSVQFDNSKVSPMLTGKTVLVTGGGGSIGSELCRQIARAQPKRLVILDIYENNAYDLQQELLFQYGDKLPLSVEIASVRDNEKIERIFAKYKPQIVFHAAAHKHVPLMENCPDEAIKNNIYGTYNVVHAADRHNVEKFVLISTDKAVNPTNVMGASKRFCEMILQSMKKVSKTTYVAVRFGNVLGSNGSVIPLFERQINNGGPVTITDPRIIRYFMTIPEAAQLVLQAGAMAKRSEIFVLDMGQPVKILDLAENLIRLSGYTPYKDIKIEVTGLRPGEKLYEELLMKTEELVSTTNHKIFIERQKEISQEELTNKLIILQKALVSKEDAAIKDAMKQVVPTYRNPDEVNNQGIKVDYSEARRKAGLSPESVVV
ncbi:polysaccharide biosynthesis protein [[Clostridium] methylpentosum DSM 5476]|uniref:Polysaccharide biosynthesis protein n=1 Tax=[Clostridium] methylpentosum DSM 5476 TaxID=537013 RepID=C0EBB2_9FIRM|nr:polysaccharide biosynthesis protein [[Clostridium] methylpentosum DSM 5476]